MKKIDTDPKEQKFILCDCHGEGILITKFYKDEGFYFSFWREGINPIKLSWWMRLKICWMTLTKGNCYDDQVIMNDEKTKEMIHWLNSHLTYDRMKKMEDDLASGCRERTETSEYFTRYNDMEQ